LRDAVAEEPPLHFDPDALVATARRQVSRRRSFVAAGLATVAVAVAAVAVPVALGRTQVRAGDQPVVTSTARTPTPTPTPWPPSGVDPVPYTPDDLRQRGKKMSSYLTDRLPELLPGASQITVGEFGGEATGQFYEGQNSMNAAVTFTVGGARYSIMVTTWAPGAPQPPTELCAADCTWLADDLVEKVEDLGEAELTTVYDYRDTGAMVSVTAYNYDMTSTVPPTYLPTTAVSREQQVAIAADPQLGL
jgi:hypothetical protein